MFVPRVTVGIGIRRRYVMCDAMSPYVLCNTVFASRKPSSFLSFYIYYYSLPLLQTILRGFKVLTLLYIYIYKPFNNNNIIILFEKIIT